MLLMTGPAHAQPARAQSSSGGVELDGFGDLTTFGGNTTDVSGASHWTWDIARSVALDAESSGGWTLDGWGGIHPFGGAPQLSGTPYWHGWDIARALVVVPGTREGYVLDGWGGIHPFGGAPQLSGTPDFPGSDIARGLDVHLDQAGTPDGGAVLDDAGGLHTFGDFPYSLASGSTHPGRDAFVALHDVDGHLYAVGRYGVVVEETTGTPMTPDYGGFVDWGSSDRLRDLVVTSASGGSATTPQLSLMAQHAWAGVIGPRGGVTLDGFGGLNSFGGLQLNIANAPRWPGWDIARSVAVLPDASGGWELDGFGGVHPFGGAAPLPGAPYWPRWDIARALVVNPDHSSGYVLDGFGGIHPFGGAPVLRGSPYWKNWDVARGLAVHYRADGTPDGGWVLDAWGGIHAFGSASLVAQPSYYSGRFLYEQLNSTYDGGLYAVSRWQHIDNLSVESFRPWWSGMPDWGGWDIARDTVLFGADAMPGTAEPLSGAAESAYQDHVWMFAFGIPPVTQGLPLDCESAALEEATIAKGHDVSQYTIFNYLPQEPGSATWSNGSLVSWGDPYTGFVGNVYGSESRGTGYGVYDPALVQVADRLGFHAEGIEGGPASEVFDAVAMGDPVVVITSFTWEPVPTWHWNAWDGRSVPYNLTDHAVTVVAVNGVAGTVTIDDVADGRLKTFTMAQFAGFWQAYLDMAVVLT